MNRLTKFFSMCALGLLALLCAACVKNAAANTLVIANGAESVALNPAEMTNAASERIYAALFEGLVGLDAQTAKAVPGLAHSWQFSADYRGVTFYLRKAQWTDDTAITARTVASSWLYLLKNSANPKQHLMKELIKNAHAYSLGAVEADQVGIETPDDYTLKVTFGSPRPEAVQLMANSAFAVLPMHVVNAAGSDWANAETLVCNGPFKLLSKAQNGAITVCENRKYWNHANVALARIVFLREGASSKTFQEFNSGKIAWIADVPPNMLPTFSKSEFLYKTPRPAVHYCYLNNNHNVLNSALVRKALATAVDRREIAEDLLDGNAVEAHGLVPPLFGWQSAAETQFSVQRAQELLAEAGYPGGKNFPDLTLALNTGDERHLALANYLARVWKENLGITVKLEAKDWDTFVGERRNNAYEISRGGWSSYSGDGASFLEQLVSTDAENAGRYSNPLFDTTMRQAALCSGDDRLALLRSAERVAVDDEAAVIPLYFEASFQLFNSAAWSGWNAEAVAATGAQSYAGIRINSVAK